MINYPYMTENKKSFVELFIEDGELNKEKLRGAMLKWTEDRGSDKYSTGLDIVYREDRSKTMSAFTDFETWIGNKTDYYDVNSGDLFSRGDVREIFLGLYDSHDGFRQYIDEHAVKKDISGSVVDGEESQESSNEGSGGSSRYGELHDAGIVTDENEVDRSKVMGYMVAFSKKVEAIESPESDPSKRGFIEAWNRFMLDEFRRDWINFTKEKLDPDLMKELADTAYKMSDGLEDRVEDKWEHSPDESEGNSEDEVPDNISEWGDYATDRQGNDTDDVSGGDSGVGDYSDENQQESGEVSGSVRSNNDYSLPVDDPVNEVFNADSREVVGALADEHGKIADAVITDVPYGQDFDPRSKGEDGIHGDSSVVKAMDINKEVFRKMRMVVKKGSPVMTFAGDSCLFEMKEVMEDRYEFKQIVVWDKQHIGMSSLEENAVRWRPQHEYIILGTNGSPRAENTNRHDGTVIGFTRPQGGDRFHPTEKPEDLMRYLVESLTEEGDVILDPFSGSGVTLDAARQLNRNYIGIEIDEEFYGKIQERLSQMTLV
jgi:site-specific DNA-methyltransferase (adenine-specific)